MVQVCKPHCILYALDTRLLIFNQTLISTMKSLSHDRYMLSVSTDIHTAITRLKSGVLSLKEGVDSFYNTCMFSLVMRSIIWLYPYMTYGKFFFMLRVTSFHNLDLKCLIALM